MLWQPDAPLAIEQYGANRTGLECLALSLTQPFNKPM